MGNKGGATLREDEGVGNRGGKRKIRNRGRRDKRGNKWKEGRHREGRKKGED